MATQTVLLVDDEEIVIGVGTQMLERLGYSVMTAQNGQEALEIYENNQENIDVVILDMIMPGMGADETLGALQAVNPEVNVLLSSGYGLDDKTKEILNRGCKGFVQKPFNMKMLSEKIGEVVSMA